MAEDTGFSIAEDGTLSDTLPAAIDVDGDTLTYALATAATNGTATVNPDGTFTYTPNANFFGTDAFTYTVADGNGGENTYTVTIDVGAADGNLEYVSKPQWMA